MNGPSQCATLLGGPVMPRESHARMPERVLDRLMPSDHRAVFLLVVLYLALFTVLTTVLLQKHGFPLDDSYIHQTVARNLAEHGTLGFSTGRSSSGATSVLWTLLQTLRYKIAGGLDPVLYNIAISYCLLALTGPLLFLMARRDGLSPSICWLLAASPAFLGNFLWLGMIGMEHLLFVVLSLAAIYLWLLPSAGLGSAVATGLACGLLALTRPEAIVFGPLLVLVTLWVPAAPERRSWRDRSVLLSLWALLTAAMLGTNLHTSGTFLPATLKGRRWLYFHGSGGPFSLSSKLRFCGSWVQRLPRQFSLAHTHQIVSVWELRSRTAVFGLVLLVLMISGAIFLLRRRPLRVGLLMGWAALHFSIYLFTFPSGGHGGRYQPLTLLLFLPMVLLGFYEFCCIIFHEQTEWVSASTIVALLLAGITSLHTWRRVTVVGINHINDTHGQIARWMNDNIPHNATFAAFDIGRVSYDWTGDVIDLGGLVDPTYVHYLQEGRVGDYLRERHIEYVLLPNVGTLDMGLQEIHGQVLVKFCSAPDDWLLGFRYTIHATQCQELYRLPVAPERARLQVPAGHR